MRSSTSYEQLIAKKLDHAAIPDLADSVWASIEAQLDVHLPVDDKQDPPSGPGSGKAVPGASRLLYVAIPAIIITAAWLIFKNKKKKKNIPPAVPQQLITPVVLSGDSNAIPFNIKTQAKKDPAKDTAGNNDPVSAGPPATGIYYDSTLQQPGLLPVNDTVSTFNPVSLPPADSSGISPSKKPKGVKGISSSDYKIVSQNKDSINRKH